MSIFESRNIPVAIVYGNHDEENCMTKEEQWEVYESYDCFVGVKDSEELSGYGTYYLPINACTSALEGITFSAPFLVVIIEAAAFANVSISVKSAIFRFSKPFSNTKCNALPKNVSPAPVVSIVFSCTNAGTSTLISL